RNFREISEAAEEEYVSPNAKNLAISDLIRDIFRPIDLASSGYELRNKKELFDGISSLGNRPASEFEASLSALLLIWIDPPVVRNSSFIGLIHVIWKVIRTPPEAVEHLDLSSSKKLRLELRLAALSALNVAVGKVLSDPLYSQDPQFI